MRLTPGTQFRRALALAGSVAALLLAGCSNFFVKPDSTTGGGSSTTSNLVYVANATAQTVSAYQISTGALTSVSGSPLSLNYVPQALVVSRANSFLYVSSATAGVYGYSIGSSGALTPLGPLAGNGQLAGNALLSMDVSPDGQWLVGLDGTSQYLDVFQINTSTGALALLPQTQYTFPSGVWTPKMVRFAPSGAYIFAALGTAGDLVFPFTTSTGAAAFPLNFSTGSITSSDNALAVNSTGTTLYIARSGPAGGIGVYAIGTNGNLTAVSGSPFAAGNTPYAVTIDPTGAYVYVANRGDGNLSGYLVGTSTALTPIGSSPFAGGALVTSLAIDKSSTYLLAGANGSFPDLTMYSFDATTAGKLDTVASVTSTSTAGLVAIATTH